MNLHKQNAIFGLMFAILCVGVGLINIQMAIDFSLLPMPMRLFSALLGFIALLAVPIIIMSAIDEWNKE